MNSGRRQGINERDKVKVVGAIVDAQLPSSIGADGYAPEAGSALEWVKKTIAV